ncbi:hypothetical protein [Actinokineospora enzanensis]|uniref:hypothetical protein n=1 Tax=Actinokineospora enzanensis TaxID=155975 RepID=UPI00035FCE09|nr:hypothetical protein [Actinokineospora enzanensis]
MSSALDIDVSDLIPLLGTAYSIRIRNDSELEGHNAIVFQSSPRIPSDAHTLAWLSKMCHPATRVSFNWQLDYNFVWGQQGDLHPGVDYEAGQELAADLAAENVVSLSYIDDGFLFHGQGNGDKGSLLISQDHSVPGSGNPNQGCVGIGMSGAGTFVLPTEPNYQAQFDPHPQYWIAFARFNAGTVVDESGMTNPENIMFKAGNTIADCVFDGKSWVVTYS